MASEPDDREMFRQSVRSLLDELGVADEIRRAEAAGEQPADGWQQLATDLGASAVLVPEDNGGLGLGFGDACALLEETGAACYNGPFLSSGVLAPLILLAADHDVAGDLKALASGELTAAVTALHHGADPTSWPAEVTATEREPGQWRVDGRARGVVSGRSADVLYVVANTPQGQGIWAVETGAAGHTREDLVTLDLARPQSDHTFTDAPARPILSPGPAPTRLRSVAALATIALSAEQVGGASARLRESLEYAKARFQFGRAIGSFQAIKHRCVDMTIQVEGALAASCAARDAVDAAGDLAAVIADPSPEILRSAAVAGAWCSQTYLNVANQSLQMHGGIGMAWEHDSHLYVRRAKASEQLFGDPIQQRQALLATL